MPPGDRGLPGPLAVWTALMMIWKEMLDSMKILRIGLTACLLAAALAGCSLRDAQVRTGDEDGSLVIDGEAIWDESGSNAEIPAAGETAPETDPAEPDTEDEPLYEYYSTREQVLADIQEGYVFRLDYTFAEEARPTVTGGHWPFQVSGEDTLELNVGFSNLLPLEEEGAVSGESRVAVRLVSPEGETVYDFERSGEVLQTGAAAGETVALTPGEWDLQVDFVFRSAGGETPAELEISARCRNLSEADRSALEELRLR